MNVIVGVVVKLNCSARTRPPPPTLRTVSTAGKIGRKTSYVGGRSGKLDDGDDDAVDLRHRVEVQVRRERQAPAEVGVSVAVVDVRGERREGESRVDRDAVGHEGVEPLRALELDEELRA